MSGPVYYLDPAPELLSAIPDSDYGNGPEYDAPRHSNYNRISLVFATTKPSVFMPPWPVSASLANAKMRGYYDFSQEKWVSPAINGEKA